MPRSAQLALFIAAALMIPLVVVLLLNLVGIEVHPLLVIGGLVLLWAFWGGSSSAASPGQSGRGGRGGDADEERRALNGRLHERGRRAGDRRVASARSRQ